MTSPRAIEARIIELLCQRRGTICPSAVARSLADDWRPLMEPVRKVARALVETGVLDITQRGRVVDGRTATGPIRLRLR